MLRLVFGVQVVLFVCMVVADVEVDVVVGVVRLVVWGVSQTAARVGRAGGAYCRSGGRGRCGG